MSYFFLKKKKLLFFLLGTVSSLGYAPISLFLLTVLSYSYSISLITKTNTKNSAFLLGFLFGLGHHTFSLYWIAISFELGNVGGYVVGGVAVVLLSAFLSLFTALAFYLIRTLNIKLGLIYYAISIVFILSCLDWIKGNILWSFPWLPISAIWSFSEITLFPFSFLGTWGYSLITYALITGVFLLNIKIKYSLLLVCPFVFVVSLYFFEKKPISHSDKQLNIRLVQPNISQKEKWNSENQDKNFNELMSLSRKKGIKEIDLIIWPETSLNIDLNRVGKKEKIFRDFINDNNVIVGAIRKEYLNNKMKIYNSLFLFNAESKAILIHDKAKLVPFGEFIPFKKILKLDKLTNGSKDFSKGNIVKSMGIKNGLSLLPLICYEVIFPNLTKKNQKYDFIVNITNDGWYGYSFGPYQHLALARIRAVKEGKTLLRVANTGISAVINYNGNIIASLDLNKKGIIDKNIKLIEKNTLYKKYGDGLFYGLIGVLCLYLLIFYRIPR